MEYVTLNNGVKMPLAGFGTYRVESSQTCQESIAQAVEAGYRLIDTASFYGNEEYLGTAVKQAGVPREALFITTKVWFTDFEREACRASLEKSFQKLGLEYLDLVLLHWPFGNVYAAWRVLEEYYKAGRIRAIGVSNMDGVGLVDLIRFHSVVPAVNQIETHLYCQQQETALWMKKYNVVHQAYAPLGHGMAKEMFAEPLVQKLAQKYGKTPVQIVLRFLTGQGISVIPKSVHPERIRENIQIFDFTLEAGEEESLRSLDRDIPLIGKIRDPEKLLDLCGKRS